MKKVFLTLFCIILSGFVCGFSDIKQKDEYTCAPVCAANCIINYNNFDNKNLVEYFSKQAKTTEKGTTANNFCKALEKFFKKNKRTAYIKYYGIRPVSKRFSSEKPLDIVKEISNGKSVILNIGVYSSEGKVYKREYGHYINAVSLDKNGDIIVTDPYSKETEPYTVSLRKISDIKVIHNKDDNERVLKKEYQYFEVENIPYLKKGEKALLNGIISVYLIYY